ncbi:LEAF RUST 10 DISEASE-RESISTANCE LOCUS RECEPTOR-LIKE PROTEIN KINASE-like 2.5 [Iris pallida]|uniref:LEAF RUST 10 DISEASE-RESISTANCE LOCUS RECEPTOR-LIKE PROTEIN KINASE-like 2.5 n=1 Tax=Iris pallida TaxID=29817 RepID=A0AAX6ET64_IRIPA|nr:LEAF RUST 10 DISEASE-RESISTANCE LOCUS RECEPTOR-LIKE PROTEIN KINASE-like 2.5 [Iris pallida]KAJ6838830.1 LEAF RUST 10 DISEASE-RESISTANCE LOCUS RECEPTOR-LIKE PROTEIN KINASE-like 2.5 [Iris pallida]
MLREMPISESALYLIAESSGDDPASSLPDEPHSDSRNQHIEEEEISLVSNSLKSCDVQVELKEASNTQIQGEIRVTWISKLMR